MLRHRVQSGVLLGAALLAALFFADGWLVLAILLAVACLAMVEFYSLLDAGRIPHFKIVGIISGLSMVAGNWFALRGPDPSRFEAEGLLLYAILAYVFIRQILHKRPDRPWDTMAGTLLGILYVGFLFSFIVKLLTAWGDVEGRFLVLYLVAVVKFTDIGAYFIGCWFGRHKFIPRISPKKTWEGVAGGIATGVAASFAVAAIPEAWRGVIGVEWYDALAIGLLLSVAGIIGDLIESLLKRAAGVKDSGTIILGMGGILDVVDSLLFAAPVLYIYARLFL